MKKHCIFLSAFIVFNTLLFSSFFGYSYPVQKEKILDYPVKKITMLEVNASINPAIFNYLNNQLKNLSPENGDLLIVKLDTPGGLVSTTKNIITLIGSTNIPVAIWVTPEGASATSAGALIASSAHILVMSEGTNIGAATPIAMSKDLQKDTRAKAINDLVALVRSLSQARGRNPDEFEKMISEAKSIDVREAHKKNVIDQIINSQDEFQSYLKDLPLTVLGQQIKLKPLSPTPIQVIKMDPGQQILNIFSHPSTAYFLFIIGAALLYFELQAPGGFVAGAVGVIFLVLAGIGFQVLPLNFGAIGLIALSFVLFILEAYITSFGILTIGGIVSLIFGSLFLFRTENSFIELEHQLVYSVVVAISLYVIFLGWFIVKTYVKPKNYFTQANDEGVISKILGENLYQVKINGEIWKAKGSHAFSEGESVKVTKQDNENLILKIEKI